MSITSRMVKKLLRPRGRSILAVHPVFCESEWGWYPSPLSSNAASVIPCLFLEDEICHAVVGLGHGERFCRRLRRVARRAEALGDLGLAWRLAEEAGQYEEAPLTAAWVYSLCA